MEATMLQCHVSTVAENRNDSAPIIDSRTCLEEEGEQRGIQLV